MSDIYEDYEAIGDRAIRMLADEHRIPGFAAVATSGRQRHRAWVEAAFAQQLARHSGRDREELLLGLVAALDVYIWKLFRRDLGLGVNAARSAVARIIRGVLATKKGT